MSNYKIREGNYNRPGVTPTANGLIFSFEGKKEVDCAILLYDQKHNLTDRIEVPSAYTIGSVRSVEVQGLNRRRLIYNYEVDGKVITDPYAKVIIGREKWHDLNRSRDHYAIYGGFEQSDFDWGEDQKPEIPRSDMIMYKLHVRGFSMDAGIRDKSRGTFRAIKDRIPYLKQLGVTTIEFMPVYEFEELVIPAYAPLPDYLKWHVEEGDLIAQMPEQKVEKINYWGYVPGNYFAVKASYSSSGDPSREWKELVRELHANGMECVMEMWFDERLNQNRILDALRYWVREYHVDGFHLLGAQVPVTAVAQDMLLSRTKIFCDGFDPMLLEDTKAYHHLFVYNEEYLYPVRQILNHQGGSMEAFLGQQRKQHPVQGYVNYIAGSNGFTLYDVFSYMEKHNQANGEDNCDGPVWNFSNNCGLEGRTTNRYVTALREKQLRNAIAILFCGQGVPLVHAGDEAGNSQDGNNNAYCQDNKTSWLNWKKMQKYEWLTDFTRRMIAFRKAHPILSYDEPMQMNDHKRLGCPDLSYHAENAWQHEFSGERMAAGAMYCGSYASDEDGAANEFVYVGYNFHSGLQHLALPKLPDEKQWHLVMDTARGREPFLAEDEVQSGPLIPIQGQSVVILVGR
jgi:glycogen operon protein